MLKQDKTALAKLTGKQEMRTHPLTGEWKFARPGHHCGAISATPKMMFFRSGFTAYYDLKADSGTSPDIDWGAGSTRSPQAAW